MAGAAIDDRFASDSGRGLGMSAIGQLSYGLDPEPVRVPCLIPLLPFADVVELVDTTDLKKLSAPTETSGVEPLKFGESFQCG